MRDYARFKEIDELLSTGHPDEAKARLRGLQASVIALHDEVDRLQARGKSTLLNVIAEMLSLPRTLVREEGLVYVDTPSGRRGPFCPLCHDAEGSLIRLEKFAGGWWCPCCGAELPLHAEPVRKEPARIIQFRNKA